MHGRFGGFGKLRAGFREHVAGMLIELGKSHAALIIRDKSSLDDRLRNRPQRRNECRRDNRRPNADSKARYDIAAFEDVLEQSHRLLLSLIAQLRSPDCGINGTRLIKVPFANRTILGARAGDNQA
jgi:hypothetical protein